MAAHSVSSLKSSLAKAISFGVVPRYSYHVPTSPPPVWLSPISTVSPA